MIFQKCFKVFLATIKKINSPDEENIINVSKLSERYIFIIL